MGKTFSWSCCEKLIQILDFHTDLSYSLTRMTLSRLKRPSFFISTHLEHLFLIERQYYNVRKVILKSQNNAAEADCNTNLALFKAINFPHVIFNYVNQIKGQITSLVSDKRMLNIV